MTVAPASPVSLLESSLAAETTRVETQVAILAKAQRSESAAAQAVLALIESAVPAPGTPPTADASGLNVVA